MAFIWEETEGALPAGCPLAVPGRCLQTHVLTCLSATSQSWQVHVTHRGRGLAGKERSRDLHAQPCHNLVWASLLLVSLPIPFVPIITLFFNAKESRPFRKTIHPCFMGEQNLSPLVRNATPRERGTLKGSSSCSSSGTGTLGPSGLYSLLDSKPPIPCLAQNRCSLGVGVITE